MNKIFKYVAIDILRNKMILFYTIFLFLISFGVFSFDDNPAKGLLSLMNVILFIVPLVSVIFSTNYIYNSAEFIELLVCQPLKRKNIWLSTFSGLSFALSVSFLLGCGIWILINRPDITGIVLVLSGCLLTVIFVAIAMMAIVNTRDKTKGIGKVILLWLYFGILFDGLVLFFLFQFSDYPLEKPLMILSALNPIDLCRINTLLRLDVSALMGYTGAVFKESFGTATGFIISTGILLLWALIPAGISTLRFNKKDL